MEKRQIAVIGAGLMGHGFENLVVAGAFAKGRRERDVYDLCAQILEEIVPS